MAGVGGAGTRLLRGRSVLRRAGCGLHPLPDRPRRRRVPRTGHAAAQRRRDVLPASGVVSAGTGRFAPSTTGPAHPGTLLAALLCWLDARALGARVILRLEDLDPERCRPEFTRAMIDDLAWLGLEWDAVEHQHANRARHEAASDRLAELGVLSPSATSRRELEQAGRRAPDGGWAYDNRDRGTPL